MRELIELKKEAYYSDETGMLLKGDCLGWMDRIPDKSIDMVLCDPPYGKTACKWDVIVPFDRMWKMLNSIKKEISTTAIFGSEPFSSLLRTSNLKEFKYDWIWEKNYSTGIGYAKYRPMNNHEVVSIFYSKNKYFPQLVQSKIKDRKLGKSNGKFTGRISETTGMMSVQKDNPDNLLKELVNPRTILEFNVVPHSTGYLHPSQKPTELLEYLIKTYTNEGDTILDFCSGSCSTAIAAINTNRRWICIEQEEKYCELSKERIENHILTR
jgi:DNA modification methylase